MTFLDAVILGIVEGVTEYLPISSTGHLILAEHFLGLSESEAGKVFAIAVQLGAIGAVLVLYKNYLLKKVRGLLRREAASLKFFLNLLVSFIPAAIIGLAFGSWIKARLFNPASVALALAVGGVVMIAVEIYLNQKTARAAKPPRSYEDLSYKDCLFIGACQCLSLWPGFSRAMATILGGRLLRLSAKDASEFSFFLALPTLGAATAYEMLKAVRTGGAGFDAQWWTALAVGLFVSFVVALVVIKGFLSFLKKYPLAVFGYYRIALAVGVYFLLK